MDKGISELQKTKQGFPYIWDFEINTIHYNDSFLRTFTRMSKINCHDAINLCHTLVCSISPISRNEKRFNVYCKLQRPITKMMVNMVIEMKNLKNIFMVWANTTFDYCSDVGKGHLDFLGIIELIVKQIDTTAIKPCPIEVYFILNHIKLIIYM